MPDISHTELFCGERKLQAVLAVVILLLAASPMASAQVVGEVGTASGIEDGKGHSAGAGAGVAHQAATATGGGTAKGGASTRCENGQAGVFACRNVDLRGHLTRTELGLPDNWRLNDIWGWEHAASGRAFALVGSMGNVVFVDVTDPDGPVVVGNLQRPVQTSPTTWRDIKVIGDMAFVVADGGGSAEHGMQVFDLTQLLDVPEGEVRSFTETARYAGFGAAHNVVVHPERNLAIVVGANRSGETCGGGLHMIDVSEPTRPAFLGCFNDGSSRRGYSHDAQCVTYAGPDQVWTGRDICVGYNEDAIVLSDITNPQRPQQVSAATYPQSGYVHQGWFTDNHRYLVQDDELDESAFQHGTITRIWDVTDLDDPVLAATFESPLTSIDHNLYVRGSLVFQANYTSGLRILDISDPENPVLKGFFDTFPQDDATNFNGAWSAWPFLSSGLVLVSDRDNGLFVLEPTDGRLTTVTNISFESRSSGQVEARWNVSSVSGSVRVAVQRLLPDGSFSTEASFSAVVGQSEAFTLSGLEPGRHVLRLVVVETDGTELEVASEEVFILPEKIVLQGPFPNPARTTSTIRVVAGEDARVRLRLYNAAGREVHFLMDAVVRAFTVRTVTIDTSPLAGGTYFIRAEAGGVETTKELTVIR